MADPCNINVTVEETPVQVSVTEQTTNITVTEETTTINVTEDVINVNPSQEIVNITFPDPDKVGPQGPAGRGIAVLDIGDDPCNVDVTNGPVLTLKAVDVGGCTKYKLLVVRGP